MQRCRPLLGTFVEITASAPSTSQAQTALRAGFTCIETVHRLMSRFEVDSDVSRLNQRAALEPTVVHPWTYDVVTLALDLYRDSGGAFDIRTAKSNGAIALHDDGRISFTTPDVEIDLGGIAKGFAVDKAIEALRENGAAAGLVNAGGDMRAFGDRPFPVLIRNPASPGEFVASLELKERALANSGEYFQKHIRNLPRTDSACKAASVLSNFCIIADALTKVCLIQGDEAQFMLERYNAQALLFD